METTASFAAEAPTHLAGTPWADFDGVKFHRDAMACARDISTACLRFISDMAVWHDKQPADRDTTRLFNDMERLEFMLQSCTGNPPPGSRAQRLAAYFAGAVPEDSVGAPDAFLSRVCFDVGRTVFPALRRLFSAYVDPARRAAWSAWSPFDADPVNDKGATLGEVQCSLVFESYYWMEVYQSVYLMLALIFNSRTLVRRIAEDALFLDMLLLVLAGSPMIRVLIRQDRDISKWPSDPKRFLTTQTRNIFQTFAEILHQNSKPWRTYLGQGGESTAGWRAMRIVAAAISSNEQNMGDPVMNALVTIHLVLSTILTPPKVDVDDLVTKAKDLWTANRALARSAYIFTDVCDWCGNPPADEQRELSRCSKCIFARYCCKEHQLAAWKGVSMEGSAVIREPHKAVCVDAKRLGWPNR